MQGMPLHVSRMWECDALAQKMQLIVYSLVNSYHITSAACLAHLLAVFQEQLQSSTAHSKSTSPITASTRLFGDLSLAVVAPSDFCLSSPAQAPAPT